MRATVARCHRVVQTALGPLTIVGLTCEEVLTGVYFAGHRPAPDPDMFGPCDPGALPLAARALRDYLAGERDELAIPYALPDRPPRHRAVWELIARIPRGRTVSYRELASAVAGHPRAVGGAVAHNPLSIVVPCHRVVGANGSLTGYAGGLERKRALLTLEGAAVEERGPARVADRAPAPVSPRL